VVAHAFNPSTWEVEAGRFLSSRTARATQRNPVSKKNKTKTLEGLFVHRKQSCIRFVILKINRCPIFEWKGKARHGGTCL
jgi:hypothetical protein